MVFLGAVSERMRLPGLSAYAAAKAGLEAFADALAEKVLEAVNAGHQGVLDL